MNTDFVETQLLAYLSLREALGIPVAAGKNRKWRIRNSHQQHPLFRSPGKQQSAGASVVSE